MKKKSTFIIFIAIALTAALSSYLLRSQYVSNVLGTIIIPELEDITGNKFSAQKIYINVIPLFVEIKGIKSFDENGDMLFQAERAKGYIGFSGLFRKTIEIKRLLVKGAEIKADKQQLEILIKNINDYLSSESEKQLKVKIKSVEISDTAVTIKDELSQVSAKGINANIILSKIPRFLLSSKEIRLIKEGLPVFTGAFETFFHINEDLIELKNLKLTTLDDTAVNVKGSFNTDKLSGRLETNISLMVESIKKMFGLKQRGDGSLTADGFIKIEGVESISNIFIDLRLKGNMYLETLMEFLAVEEELKGDMNLEGSIKGYLNNLTGKANARLLKGNLFGIDVDKLNCVVSYSDGIMTFTDGRANLYGGTAKVEAMINLPVVDYYSFKVIAKDVNSKNIFKLINWDPEISAGKVTAEISSSGSEFNPRGNFYYKAVKSGNNILERIREIRGEFEMKGESINFPKMHISSDKSSLFANGTVDLATNKLGFSGDGKSSDFRDFSAPYFTGFSGSGDFQYNISGTFEDPLLDLNIASNNSSFSTKGLGISDVVKDTVVTASSFVSNLTYAKKLLTLKRFKASGIKFVSNSGVQPSASELMASGKIHFPKASVLFDLIAPDYDLNISVKRVSVKNLSGIFVDSPPMSGNMDADFRLYGKPDDIMANGEFNIDNLSFYDKYRTDNAAGKAVYAKRNFSFSNLKLNKVASVISVNGMISLDKKFLFFADSPSVLLKDIYDKDLKEMKMFDSASLKNLKIKAEGSFENPRIDMTGDVQGFMFKGQSPGKGKISAVLRGRDVNINAKFLDGKMDIAGNVRLVENMPWEMKIDLNPARYDFIIASYLKDVPEDLLLSLDGDISASGDRDHITAFAKIKRAHLSLYGIGFTNDSDIIARLHDKKLSIESLLMKSDSAEVSLSGSMIIGQNYDLLLEGYSSLAPIKSLSSSIDTLKGDASFVFSASGDWNKPKINGGIDIANGALSFRDIHYRLTSANAYIYLDEDRIVIERAAGKISGGDIALSGIAHLERFSLKRFFLETRLRGITASISKDFRANFDGDLYYRGTLQSQTILGDIKIKSARYTERVEWKSWLLKAQQKGVPKTGYSRLDKTNLNIRVSGANLIIDNNVARLPVKMDLFLRGTIGLPILFGRVEANEGVVYFRNTEFKVLKAITDFSDQNRINPYFDIVAETKIKSYNIRLALTGLIEQFNLSLSSEPQLSETDIFSLLTVGQIGKDLKGLEGGIGAGEATSFLTGKLQDVVEERLKTITGFDRIQVDPYVSRSAGTVSPRVTVAKRLLGDRLYVTYSSSVGTGEEQVWKLEYSLEKNISLVGIRDERGSIGGDVKFRFEFK